MYLSVSISEGLSRLGVRRDLWDGAFGLSVNPGLTAVGQLIGPPVYQCGEHWSGGPGSLVRGAKEKLYTPDRLTVRPQNLVRNLDVRIERVNL